MVFARLPPLSSLRAFEAAARLGSFKDAAEELFVTPAAVSHQVRTLEDALGVALFVRRPRQVELTDVGRALAPALNRGFVELRKGVDTAMEQIPVLTVSTTPAFAALRLVPALSAFHAAEPHLRVELDTSMRAIDLHRDSRIDVAIRYGRGTFEGLHNTPVTHEWFLALAAPGRFDPQDLDSDTPLLGTRWQRPTLGDLHWARWFAESKRVLLSHRRIIEYGDELHVLQAAVAGHGIALGSNVLAADLIDRELLEPLCPDQRLRGGDYVAVCLPKRAREPKIASFVAWLSDLFGAR